eukprot:NODE_263_length_12530_cov_0.434881.p1 type:complete len:836 gc:universal NODE_263_length_12530_cov_0.434881:9152-11659(+)
MWNQEFLPFYYFNHFTPNSVQTNMDYDSSSVKSEHVIDINYFQEAQQSLLAGIQHIQKLLPRLKHLEIVKVPGSCQVQTFRNHFKLNQNFQHSSWLSIYRKDILKGLDVDALRNHDDWPTNPSQRILSKSGWDDINSYLESFKIRLSDETNRLLVVGDLNSGKSSLVNSLLGRNVVCVDQMPLTACFCEVIAGKDVMDEVVHAIPKMDNYDFNDKNTFVTHQLSDLKRLLADDPSPFEFLKVYVSHHFHNQTSKDFLEKMSLIDSPGLNIDAEKTLNLFRKQREIDVIVFVVNAENLITYSGQEFLKSISNEKPYFFLIVNKFDNIVDKARCKRDILGQLKKLSQFVSEDTSKMVHFVSAKKVLEERVDLLVPSGEDQKLVASFSQFESHLKKFIVLNRTASKLLPAKKFMTDMLKDCLELVDGNLAQNIIHFAKESDVILRQSPRFISTIEKYESMCIRVNRIISDTVKCVEIHVKRHLDRFIDSFLNEWPNVNFTNYPSSWGKDISTNDNWLQYRLREQPNAPLWRGAFDTLAYARELQDYFNDCIIYELTVVEQKVLYDIKEAISDILALYSDIDIPFDFLVESPEQFINQKTPRSVQTVNQILKENWTADGIQEILQSDIFTRQVKSINKVELHSNLTVIQEPRLRPKVVGLFDIITAKPATRSLIVPHFFLSAATSISSIYHVFSYSTRLVYNFFTKTPVILHSTTLATAAVMLARVSDVVSFFGKSVDVLVKVGSFIYSVSIKVVIDVGSYVSGLMTPGFSSINKSSVKPLYMPRMENKEFDRSMASRPLILPNRQLSILEKAYGFLPNIVIPNTYIYGAAVGLFGNNH